MSCPGFRHRAAVGVLLLFAASGCNDGPPADSARNSSQSLDGHRRMVAELRKVAERSLDDNEYFEDATVRWAESELSALPTQGNDLSRISLEWKLGYHKLRLGRTEEAISHFEAAHSLLPAVRQFVAEDQANLLLFSLAVANLRLGENRNCVHCTDGESCLFPIRAQGVHTDPTGSRRAIAYLEELLGKKPQDLTARWLLNVAYMTIGEYPDGVPASFLIPPDAFQSQDEFPEFRNIASTAGLDVLSHAGGAVCDDFDGDGFLDVIVSSSAPDGPLRYFRNSGDGRFTDRSEQAGLTGINGGLNLVHADYDDDGDLDVLVLRGAWLGEAGRHPNSLLQNDGSGRFRDVTFESGLGQVHYPTQTAAWADYDNDGDLDLYVGNENYPCQLFENAGDGRFRDVALRAGVLNGGYTKGVVWGDYDNDGLPDLYLSNLGQPNRLYRNNGDKTFTDVARMLGVTGPLQSFPVWFWDFNNDGALDLFAPSYQLGVRYVAADFLGLPHNAEPACLYQNDGRGGFREVSREQNLTRVMQPMGCNFGDLDNDGFPDFYLATGYVGYDGLMPNLLFHNRGGSGFADVTATARVGHLQKGHGVSFADLDNDGDQDLFCELGGAFAGDAFYNALFENPGFGNHSITIRLVGQKSNSWGIGARIRVQIDEGGERRSVYKWVNSGGSFGGNPLRQEIGLGRADSIELLEVHWPTTGLRQQFHHVAADQFIEITEGNSEYRRLPRNLIRFATE